jgi:hypothetical protein
MLENPLFSPYHVTIDKIPTYTDEEKRIIAWSICWEGSISLSQYSTTRKDGKGFGIDSKIHVSNTNYWLLKQFAQIAKVGKIYRTKQCYHFTVHRMVECKYLLEAIQPFMPAKNTQLEYTLKFINSRLSKSNLEPRDSPYSEDEIECFHIVRKANKRLDLFHKGAPPLEAYEGLKRGEFPSLNDLLEEFK